MNLRKLLSENTIRMQLTSDTKKGVIAEMINSLADAGKIRDRETALSAIIEREKKMSTGMQHGIAIPHGKTDTVDELVATVALKPEGVDFEALDGQPSTIFIMTLSPINRAGPHIQFLAEMSQLLNDPQRREAVLRSQSPRELLDVLMA